MAINLKDTVQIIRGKKTDIAARTGANGELNWADDTYELYIHDGKTRGGHLIGKASGTAGVVGGAGIAVSTSDGISTVSIKRDPSNVLYATTDGAGVRIGTSGALQITAQNALDLRVAEGGGIIVDSNGVKIDSAVLSSVFRYAGQVNSVDDLPSDAQPGDVYDVKDSGANYVWSGTSWDNLGGIMSVDAAPTQGSTNPVASGGVYDAIQDAKLNGDGTTVTVADNTITAKDIAIDGDASDLASARGLLGTLAVLPDDIDLNTVQTQGFYRVRGTTAINSPTLNFSTLLVFAYSSSTIIQVIFVVNSTPYYRSLYNGVWTAWASLVSSATIGDGITVNNGIISVPEYEGATADTAATSGLVPPAAAGEQDKVLRGDGEWGEYLPTAGGNMTGKISSTANTVLEHTDSVVSIADTSRDADYNRLLVASLDKDGKRGGGVEVSYAEEGYREMHFTMRNRTDTGWIIFGVRENVDGSSVGVSPSPSDDSDTSDIATTAWVRDRIAEIDFPSEVTLSDSVTSDSSTTAASSKAVKTAYDTAVTAQATADSKVSKSGDTMTGSLVATRFHARSSDVVLTNFQDMRATLGTAPANELDEQVWFNDKDGKGMGILQHIMYPEGRNSIMIMTRTQDDNNWGSLYVTQTADRTTVAGTSGTQFHFGNGTAIWVE